MNLKLLDFSRTFDSRLMQSYGSKAAGISPVVLEEDNTRKLVTNPNTVDVLVTPTNISKPVNINTSNTLLSVPKLSAQLQPTYKSNYNTLTTPTFDANTDVAALRKSTKLLLMANGMSRRQAKNQATQMVALQIQSLGDKASQTLKDWLNARSKLYHFDAKGNIVRNKSNFWNGFATVLGGLALGPTGAVMGYELTRNQALKPITDWGKDSGEITPSAEWLKAEKRLHDAAQGNSTSAQPAIALPSAPQALPVSWLLSYWDKQAIKHGFKSELEVRASQRLLGVSDDGKWKPNSQASYNLLKLNLQLPAQTVDVLTDAPINNTTNPLKTSAYGIFPLKTNTNSTPYTVPWVTNRQLPAVTLDKLARQRDKFKVSWNSVRKSTNTTYNGSYQTTNSRGHSVIRTNSGHTLYDTGRAKLKNGTMVSYHVEDGRAYYFSPGGRKIFLNKQGGTIEKHQQGGTMTKEDLQEQILTYATLGMIGYANANQKQMNFTTAVLQVMELALTKPEAIQEIAQNEELVKSGIEIMKSKEPETLLMISKPGGMRKVLAQLKNKTKMAKSGSKLEYILHLKGICPEGYEMTYMKAGGKVCPVCKKKAKKAQEGAELENKIPSNKMGGAISELMNQIKYDIFKCGGIVKKAEAGAEMDDKKPVNKIPPKKPVPFKDVDGLEFEYPDSATYKKHTAVLNKLHKRGMKSLTPQEKNILADGNKYSRGGFEYQQ